MVKREEFLMSLSELSEPVVGSSTFSGYSDSFFTDSQIASHLSDTVHE